MEFTQEKPRASCAEENAESVDGSAATHRESISSWVDAIIVHSKISRLHMIQLLILELKVLTLSTVELPLISVF